MSLMDAKFRDHFFPGITILDDVTFDFDFNFILN